MWGRIALGLSSGAIAITMMADARSAALPSTGQIFMTVEHRIVRINDMTGTGWTTFGAGGGGVNQFFWPQSIFVSPSGQIFVADTGGIRSQEPQGNHRIVRIDNMTGVGWTTFGTRGGGINQFDAPFGIFVNAAGQIFVADAFNHRIVRINDMAGTGWTTFGTVGSGINQFSSPTKIFVSPAGQIYVGDFGNRRIVRINDMSGKGWTTFGTLGHGVNQFVQQSDIFVSPVGQIYATDFGSNRIVRIDNMAGAGWTTFGSSRTFNGLMSIFVSSAGQIYVGDSGRGIVRINDMTGTGWTELGPASGMISLFSGASGIFVR